MEEEKDSGLLTLCSLTHLACRGLTCGKPMPEARNFLTKNRIWRSSSYSYLTRCLRSRPTLYLTWQGGHLKGSYGGNMRACRGLRHLTTYFLSINHNLFSLDAIILQSRSSFQKGSIHGVVVKFRCFRGGAP